MLLIQKKNYSTFLVLATLCCWFSSVSNPLVFVGLPTLPIQAVFPFIFFFCYLSSKKINYKFVFTCTLSLIFYLPSVVFSEYWDVALFKYINYCVGLILFVLFSEYDESLESTLFTIRNFFRILILASLPIYFIGLGYTRNETGFAGSLNHPQVFGVFCSFCILFELYCSRIKNKFATKFSLFFIILCFAFVIMSEARTSFVSLIFAMIFILLPHMSKLSYKKILILGCILLLAIIFSSDIYDSIIYVLTKSGRGGTNVLDSLEASRFFLVEKSLCNFQNNLMVGIGFQVSNGECQSSQMIVEYFHSIPISAPIEKGVFYSGLVEEVGIVGTFGFFIFLYGVITNKVSNYNEISIFIFIVLTNFGEATLFSFGANGLLLTFILIVSLRNNRKRYN